MFREEPRVEPEALVRRHFPAGCEIDHVTVPAAESGRRTVARLITYLAHCRDRTPEIMAGYLAYANEASRWEELAGRARSGGVLRTIRGFGEPAPDAFRRYQRREPAERAAAFRVNGRPWTAWAAEDVRLRSSLDGAASFAGCANAAELYEAFTDGRVGGGAEPGDFLIAYYVMRCVSLDTVDQPTARRFGSSLRGLSFSERRLLALLFPERESLSRRAAVRLGRGVARSGEILLARPRLREGAGAPVDAAAVRRMLRDFALVVAGEEGSPSGPGRERDFVGYPHAGSARHAEERLRSFDAALRSVRLLRERKQSERRRAG